MGQVKVDKVRITIGRKALELTPDELRELREVLDLAFPPKTVFVSLAPIVIDRPVWPGQRWSHWGPVDWGYGVYGWPRNPLSE